MCARAFAIEIIPIECVVPRRQLARDVSHSVIDAVFFKMVFTCGEQRHYKAVATRQLMGNSLLSRRQYLVGELMEHY